MPTGTVVMTPVSHQECLMPTGQVDARQWIRHSPQRWFHNMGWCAMIPRHGDLIDDRDYGRAAHP
jgi:hypothetical protein